jgi:hypothetical protein
VFSDIKGIIHYEFVQPELSGKKISLQVLEQLQQHIHQTRPNLWLDNWILHHGDSLSYTAFWTRSKSWCSDIH